MKNRKYKWGQYVEIIDTKNPDYQMVGIVDRMVGPKVVAVFVDPGDGVSFEQELGKEQIQPWTNAPTVFDFLRVIKMGIGKAFTRRLPMNKQTKQVP